MVWQLWIDRRIQLSEVQHLSIDDIDRATEVVNALRAARPKKKKPFALPPGFEE